VPHTPLIAVVDDDHSVRESLGGLFRSVGFAARGFASAADFLQSGDLPQTDCVILDVRMPGMTGLELQRVLITSHPDVPVIFMTAHDDARTRSQALSGGAVDYLIKPFSEEELLDAVQVALGSR
jgi:FixJ family two-component response regulator